MDKQFAQAVDYFEAHGLKYVSVSPYVFKGDAETLTFRTQAEAKKEYIKRHKRKKGFCIVCGNPMEEIPNPSGARTCRCDKCFKEYLEKNRAEKCLVSIKKETKEKLLRLGAKWKLTYSGEVIDRLLEDKKI